MSRRSGFLNKQYLIPGYVKPNMVGSTTNREQANAVHLKCRERFVLAKMNKLLSEKGE